MIGRAARGIHRRAGWHRRADTRVVHRRDTTRSPTRAAGALPPSTLTDEEQSGLAGIPDEGLNLIDEDTPPFDESDSDRHY